jgi:hypothetical protein|tara:strand:+ start:31 stop:468 length:438 start_codon:yes stop_codon:yes gene_type:complete
MTVGKQEYKGTISNPSLACSFFYMNEDTFTQAVDAVLPSVFNDQEYNPLERSLDDTRNLVLRGSLLVTPNLPDVRIGIQYKHISHGDTLFPFTYNEFFEIQDGFDYFWNGFPVGIDVTTEDGHTKSYNSLTSLVSPDILVEKFKD